MAVISLPGRDDHWVGTSSPYKKLEALSEALNRVNPEAGFYTNNPYGEGVYPKIVDFNWLVRETLQELIEQCKKNT